MRKLVFLLFPALAALSVLGCSNNDDMPCLDCYEGLSPYAYCLTYNIYSGYQECSYMPVALCTPNYYGHDHTCGGYLRSSSSSRPVSSSSFSSSSSRPVSSSSSRPVSSSSSRPVSSSSEYTGYTGGSCNASDYGRVEIGNQVWMAKNWGCYAAGSECYNNDPANCATYGRLYDWATAMSVCPSGWHIPNDDEWDELVSYVESYWGCSDCAARYLKSRNDWSSGGNGVDKFGFAALPGGNGGSDGNFYNVGGSGSWWSASEYYADGAYLRGMSYYEESVGRYSGGKSVNLLSVRCVKD